jgi:HEAT repeat protein
MCRSGVGALLRVVLVALCVGCAPAQAATALHEGSGSESVDELLAILAEDGATSGEQRRARELRQAHAAQEIGRRATASEAVVLGLMEASQRPWTGCVPSIVVMDAEVALRELAPAALAVMTTALRHDDARIRIMAARTLGMLEEDARPVVLDLLNATTDDNAAVRAGAAWAAGRIDIDAPRVADRLVDLYEHDSTLIVQHWAARGLRRGGPYVVEQLSAMLHDGDERLRERTARTLGWLGANGAPAVSELIAALDDESSMVRASAAQSIGYIGPAAALAVPALIALRKDDNQSVRSAVALTLGDLGP